MSERKYIQPQRFQTTLPKSQTIARVEEYINSHIEEFKNGEEVVIEYLTEGQEKTHSTTVVSIKNGEAKLSAQISEKDTVKIIEKDGTDAPNDRKSLWLSDNWDEELEREKYDASDLKSTVKQMAEELKVVRHELALCKDALTNTLGGGDILLNSTKYFLENEYEAEMPEDATYPYATGDTQIYSWNVYIGPTPLTDYNTGGLYKSQRYYPKVRAFNSAGEEIEITEEFTITMSCGGGTAEVIFTGNTLYAVTSGDSNFFATILDTNHGFIETKTYLIKFEKNEEPSYQQYNVKHLLVKHSESFDYMMQHADYLLIGEFCWCIKEQALYLKETTKNGTIQLFKINGQGSVTPTGKTEEIVYSITEDGVLMASSTEGSVTIDDDGVLYLIGEIDEEGTLILNSTEIEPEPTPPPTPTGETSSITATIDKDGTLVIISENGTSYVDRDGTLILNAQIDSNGTLNIIDF